MSNASHHQDRRSAIHGLYALTPDTINTDVLLAQVEQVLSGGAHILQYRNKSTDAALRHQQAEALLRLCRRHGVPLIINDDLALACRIDADGVHLGRDDGDLRAARTTLGPTKLLGASCYRDVGLAVIAHEKGADHVAFGSFFPSSTKPSAVRASPAILSAARARLGIPIVAIGGITAANAGELIQAGAAAVAVVSALFDATNIAASAREFAHLFKSRPL
jgi:thiamine-phosphate pyrophosphorylase